MSRIESLLGWLEDNPKDPFLYYALGQEYLKVDKNKSLQYFELLVDRFPSYGATYYHLAMLYDDLDEIDKAERTYRQGIEVLQKAQDTKLLSELEAAFYNFEMENL